MAATGGSGPAPQSPGQRRTVAGELEQQLGACLDPQIDDHGKAPGQHRKALEQAAVTIGQRSPDEGMIGLARGQWPGRRAEQRRQRVTTRVWSNAA
jgi:hypothetical protein